MDKPKVIEYVLTDEEHKEMCGFVEKGFRDSLRKFLEGIATSKVTARDGESVILSPKTFNPDPNSSLVAPLVLAAMEGRIGILQLFLDVFRKAIDINHGSYMTYPDLFHLGHRQVVSFKTRGLTALNAASVNGFTNIVKVLMEAGADLNKPDHFGNSPLCNASRYGRADTVEFLLKSGANSSHRNHTGYAAVHLAAIHGQIEVIKVMVSKMIDLLFPKQSGIAIVPCPLYLAAAHGWQPVVDLLVSHAACPNFAKIDARLLLGAASRMFWTAIKHDSMKGVVDIWIEARDIKDTRGYHGTLSPYDGRMELFKKEDLRNLLNNPKVEEESLYQCLIIHERCMGSSNSYNWVFLAGMKLFQRKHYREAEQLWQRAMELHYEIAKQNMTGVQSWQHDLKGTVEYMVQFGTAIETMIKDGYQPQWEGYIDYALQQLKMGILMSLQTNMLDTASGILKVYYCLLQIFSCWILTERGPFDTSSGFQKGTKYSDALLRSGQTFVDTASVLTQSNILHLAIYPSAGLKIRWQTIKRLPGLLQALIDWGAVNSINDLDHHGNRPLHVAAKLPNKAVREALVAVLLRNDAHIDALNRDEKTPADVFKISYPNESHSFIEQVPPKLMCLAARIVCEKNVSYNSANLDSRLNVILRLHSLPHAEMLSTQQWITLPQI